MEKATVKGGSKVVTKHFVISRASECGNSSYFAKALAEQTGSRTPRGDAPAGAEILICSFKPPPKNNRSLLGFITLEIKIIQSLGLITNVYKENH